MLLSIFMLLISILATFSLAHHHPWVAFLWFIGIFPGFILPFFTHFCATYVLVIVMFLVTGFLMVSLEDNRRTSTSQEFSRPPARVLHRTAKYVPMLFILAFCAVSILIGPGGATALVELPFGSGPYTSSGEYCSAVHTFYNDLYVIKSNSPKSTAKRVSAEFTYIARHAPDSVIRTDLRNWYVSIASNSAGSYSGVVGSINRWLSNSCGSVLYRFPYEFNNPYSGFVGVRLH